MATEPYSTLPCLDVEPLSESNVVYLGHAVGHGPADDILLGGGVVHGVRSVDAVGLAKID